MAKTNTLKTSRRKKLRYGGRKLTFQQCLILHGRQLRRGKGVSAYLTEEDPDTVIKYMQQYIHHECQFVHEWFLVKYYQQEFRAWLALTTKENMEK
jgi:hypothetical protein